MNRSFFKICLCSLVAWLLAAGIHFPIAAGATPRYTSLHQFSARSSTYPYPNPDGAIPQAALVLGSDGDFYGTTANGGVNGTGTIFKITQGGTLTTLYTFSSTVATFPQGNSDGAYPNGLTLGSDGDFYGTATGGGANGTGTAFKITPTNIFIPLHSFSGTGGSPNNEGSEPNGLILGSDGNFYGTAVAGGTAGSGTVFRMTPSGTVTVLHSLGATFNEGYQPVGGVVEGSDGSFYGTTSGGNGTIYKVAPSGMFTTLFAFSGATSASGFRPEGGLVLGSDGNFYGTTEYGGTTGFSGSGGGNGTVFKITLTGVLTTLYTFSAQTYPYPFGNSDGANPQGGLVQGSDGNFYGTTQYGGSVDNGTVFKITPTGSFTTLYTFSQNDAAGRNSDGFYPLAGLRQGSDGDFYGTTQQGGSAGIGTVFKITPSGLPQPTVTLTLAAMTDHSAGYNAIAQSGDGTPLTYLWSASPPATSGFTAPTTGRLASGATFANTLQVSQVSYPLVNLTVMDIYGQVASAGTAVNFAAIPTAASISPNTVALSTSATQTFVAAVTDQFGAAIANPSVTWSIIAGNGTLTARSPTAYEDYTAPAARGAVAIKAVCGAVQATASIKVYAVPTITSFTPTSGRSGAPVTITGTNFTDASSVTFSGSAATFKVNSSTQITATVPAVATTGAISVSTPAMTVSSNASFTVIPSAPTITGFIPASGPVGTTMTITGTNLSGTTVVGFQGAHAASFTVNPAGTQITAAVPMGAVTGPIAVLTNGIEAKSSARFTVTGTVAKPTITGFSPASGPVGTVVTITGANLGGTTVVGFQGEHATSFSVNPAGTQITATVPAGAQTGPIAILANDMEAKSSTSYTVTP